jgi:hypothetical protein
MGGRQSQISGDVELWDISGVILAAFNTEESLLGGWRIGGGGLIGKDGGLIDIDDLMRRFAESVAESTVRWARGQPIK